MLRRAPPPNYKAGLVASAEARSARSGEHQRHTWALIVGLAAGLRRDNIEYDGRVAKVSTKRRARQPRTLEQYAVALNGCGSSTAKGLPWTASLVQRVFKAHHMTPKKLGASLLPQPFLPKPSVPRLTKTEHLARLAPYGTEENHFGFWTPAVVQLPRKGDLVRLRQAKAGFAAATVFRVTGRKRKLVRVVHLLLQEATFDVIDLDRWVEKPDRKNASLGGDL